jgi:hypothetical protein
MDFLQPYIYVIVLSFLISLNVYLKRSSSYYYLKYFAPFLFVTACVETYAAYLRSQNKHNTQIYNIFSLIEFAFYFSILALVTKDKLWKKVILISIPVYLILALINIFFIVEKDHLHTLTYCLGSVMIAVYCIHYFMELFRQAEWGRLTNNPAFWICSGLLFFYCCGFFYFGLMNYWIQNPKLFFLLNYYLLITNTLNIALYTLFSIAFLCSRARKYTLSP